MDIHEGRAEDMIAAVDDIRSITRTVDGSDKAIFDTHRRALQTIAENDGCSFDDDYRLILHGSHSIKKKRRCSRITP